MNRLEGLRLILMDGTTLENATAGSAGGFLWCMVPGMTMAQAASVFFDPEKTGHIVFQYGEMSDEYDGYTTCTAIMTDTGGNISVSLTRGNVNV